MRDVITILLLMDGVELLLLGFGRTPDLWKTVSRHFTGPPTSPAVWLLGLGSILVLLGLQQLSHRPKDVT